LLGSVVILALLDELVVQYNAHGGIAWLPVVVVLTGALVVVGSGVWVSRSSVRPSPVKASLSTLVPMVVPFYFHVFFLIMLFVANVAPRLPVLVGISLTMLWNVYMIQSTVWDWIPDVRDAAIPFVTGALELFLNHTITQSVSAWLLGLAGIAIIGALGTWHMDRRAGKEPENAKLLNFLRNHHRLLGLHYIGSAILMLLLALISYVGSIEAADGVQGVRGVLAVGIVLLVGGGLAFSVNISHRYWYKAIVYARTGHLPTRFGEDPLK
jgi:hypothetical protein